MYRLLIVDDDFEQRQLIADCLRDAYAYDIAVTGTEALEAYRISIRNNAAYDAVLLDRVMPGMDGLEVLAQIRAIEDKAGIDSGEGVPIIIITGQKKDFTKAFSGGCDGYILKPFKPSELRQKIEETIAAKKERAGTDPG